MFGLEERHVAGNPKQNDDLSDNDDNVRDNDNNFIVQKNIKRDIVNNNTNNINPTTCCAQNNTLRAEYVERQYRL